MLDQLANTTTPSVGLNLSFRCGDCGRAFESRRSVSNHHSKTHGKVGQQPDRGNNAGRFVCEFCGDHFPTNRSLGQHIRNRHMAEASSQRTAEQRSVQRLWSTEEHQRFVDTIRDLGPVSNVDIAHRIGTKSAKTVGVRKRIYLRDYPETRVSRYQMCRSNISKQQGEEDQSQHSGGKKYTSIYLGVDMGRESQHSLTNIAKSMTPRPSVPLRG